MFGWAKCPALAGFSSWRWSAMDRQQIVKNVQFYRGGVGRQADQLGILIPTSTAIFAAASRTTLT
jgi:hypothetical protein